MEPVTGLFMGFMLFVSIAQETKITTLEEHVHNLSTETAILSADIDTLLANDAKLKEDYINLGAKHSSAVAGLKTVDMQHEERMDTLKSAIDYTLTTLATHDHEE